MTINEEMENYRMALAYISKQSSDQQSRELAETALNAFPDCGLPDQWRPIETAPKDGTEIIGVYLREWEDMKPSIYGPWTVAWDGRKWRSSWDGQEVVNYMSDFGTDYKEPDCDPTHWTPLPKGPVSRPDRQMNGERK